MTFSLAYDLGQALPKLSIKDQDFARSLLAGYDKYGRFSDRQEPYVIALIDRANGDARPQAGQPAALDLSQVNAMFDSARAAGKKRMALRFIDAKGGKFAVSPAGESSSNVGCLYVKSDGLYLGKITPAGQFKGAYGSEAAQAAKAHAALTEFVKDPKAAAVTYGVLTGTCMFCAKDLTDERSIKAKYGPICAETYGLPWGE